VKSQTAKGLDAMRGRMLDGFAGSVDDEPHWAPDAAALARTGDREIRRRRVLAAVGSFVAAVAVAVGSIAVLGRPWDRPQPVGPVPTTHQSAADVLKYWRFDMGSEFQADSPYPQPTTGPTADQDFGKLHVTTPEGQTLLAVARRLDPDLSHLHVAAGSGPTLKVSDGPQMSGRIYVKAVAWWTPDPHRSEFGRTSGAGVVAVTMQQAPPSGVPDPVVHGAPCGVDIGMLAVETQQNLLNWSPCVTASADPLPDGSVIQTTHAPDGPGTATAVVRVFPDHSLIGVVATDFAAYDDGVQTPNSWQYVQPGSSFTCAHSAASLV